MRNATEGLNVVAHGWGMHNLQPGDEILMSVAEHHSSLAPWQLVAGKTGARIVDVNFTAETEEIDLRDLQRKLSSKTKVVVMVHLSNVLGSVLPAEQVCRMAHETCRHWVATGLLPLGTRWEHRQPVASCGAGMSCCQRWSHRW